MTEEIAVSSLESYIKPSYGLLEFKKVEVMSSKLLREKNKNKTKKKVVLPATYTIVSSSVNDKLSDTFTFTPKICRTDKLTAAAEAVMTVLVYN